VHSRLAASLASNGAPPTATRNLPFGCTRFALESDENRGCARLRIDGSWLTESAQELRSLRQVFATLTRVRSAGTHHSALPAVATGQIASQPDETIPQIFWSSPYVYGSILTAVYAIMGVIRCPGQSWIHALVAFSVGVAKAVPICLVVRRLATQQRPESVSVCTSSV
jgi:hypothetical protein